MGCINVIVGVPGVGKTATARNYCQEQPNTWMITLSPAHSSVTGVCWSWQKGTGD